MKKSGIVFIAKEPTLTYSQLDKLADVLIAVGQLALAFMVLPFLIPGLDKSKLIVIIFGVVTAVTCWLTSVLIVRRLE